MGRVGHVDGVIARPADVVHAPAIARIHWDSWVATYGGVFPQQSFDEFPLAQRERLWTHEAGLNADASRRSQLLVALQGERVLGFAHVGPYRVQPFDTTESGADGELRALYLDPALQRRGIGRLLWSAATRQLQAMNFAALRLWVIDGNHAAEDFYRAMGAVPVGSTSFDAHGKTLREICYRLAPL